MRNRFDQFAKLMMREGYAPAGAVETDAEVSPDAARIDVWFTPNPALRASTLAHLGLLGRLARTACTVEPFHATPDGDEIMGCICKHHLFRRVLARRTLPPPLPIQWIISSGRPRGAITGAAFRRSPRRGPGVYEGPPLTHTNLIVVSELPQTQDTLLIRLMGRGRALRRAIHELNELPSDAPERTLALPLLLRLHLEVPADPAERTRDDEEFYMSTQDIVENLIEQSRRQGFQQGLEKGLQQGLEKGRSQELIETLLALYKSRFGEPPRTIAAAVERTRELDVLRGWLAIVATGSSREIAAAIRGQAPRHRTRPAKRA